MLGKLIYEGKSKKVYELGKEELLLVFKDEVTAFDGKYRDKVNLKGFLSAKLSAKLFEVLEDEGIKTHYLCYDGKNSIKVRKCEAIPLEVIVRNYAYGSFLRRMPLVKELRPFKRPLVEFHFKSDELHDPLVTEQDVIEAEILSEKDLENVKNIALKINDILSHFWKKRGLTLIDFKIEFGRAHHGNDILLIDDLSGDSMRVMTSEGKHLDKEVYRRTRAINLLVESYKKLAELAGDPSKICKGE